MLGSHQSAKLKLSAFHHKSLGRVLGINMHQVVEQRIWSD